MNESGDKNSDVPTEEKTSPSAVAKALVEGSLIADRYQIIQKIGGGGMGVVFKAKDLILKRLVAVKVLHSSYTDQDILRFQQEARACSAFNHPNLLTVLDFGLTEGNQPYLAMEYVSGTTLAHWIKNGKLDLLKSLATLKQVCDGMAKAHEFNVVHRDLKPSNILLVDTADGIMQVKIIDFGIAKRTDEDQKLTATGAGIGSPLYMSPEQVRGELVDNRSDIYSFGCIAYEMITGHVPFRGKDSLSTMSMHLTQEPPSLAVFVEAVEKGQSNSEITEVLETLYEIVYRCLSKKPLGRFHSFADVKDALLEFEESIAEHSIAELAELSPLRPSGPRLLWLTTGIILLGAMVSVLAYFKMESSKHISEVTKKDKIERQVHKDLNDAQDWKPFLTDIEKAPLFGYSANYQMKELKPSREFDLTKIRAEVDKGEAECLDLGYCMIKGNELEALAGCNLRGIRLTSNPLSPEAFVQLSKIPSLEFIDLAKCNLTAESALYPLAKLKKLDTLILDGNKFDGSIFGPIARMPNLDSLSLSYCPLNGDVPESLGNLKNLRSLFLYGTGCDDRLAKVLSKLRHLEKLNIANNKVTGVTLKTLKNFPIVQLSIGKTGITGNDLVVLSSLPIQQLGVSFLALDDNSCRTLSKLENLTRLNISYNKITDTGLTRLARLPNLNEIKCAGNPLITPRGMAGFQALKTNIILFTEKEDPFPLY